MLKNLENIEGLTPEQITAINGLAGGLHSKNNELLDKINAGKTNLSASESEVETLRLFKENADLLAAESAKDWDASKTLINERHTKELEKLTGESKTDKDLIRTLLIDNGLSAALDGVNINPALKDGAIAMLHNQCVISEGKAMIGDKTLSEAITEWSGSDMGKAYTLAANNSGNGSGGGSQTPTDKKMSEMTEAERTSLYHSNREQFNSQLAEMKAG